MEARELRIGNIVDRNYENGSITDGVYNYTVEPETFTSVNELGEPILTDLQGIPLNEEWLLKMGFEEREKGKSWYHITTPNFELFKQIENMGYYKAGRYSSHEKCWYGISEKLKTVHQLQNLYFALTNKELTI